MTFRSVYWTCAPLTSREIPGDAVRSSTLSSPILPVSSRTSRIAGNTTLNPGLIPPLDGVRAGAKRLGRKKERVADPPHPARPREYVFGRAIRCSSVTPQFLFCVARDDDQPYVPPTKPYELSALAADLVVLARYLLKPGGRLVFFLPTVIDEYKELDLDSLLCDGMQVIANSLQDFGAWGRRVRRRRHFRSALCCIFMAFPQLITIRKATSQSYPPPIFDSHAAAPNRDESEEGDPSPLPVHVPAHRDFREKYFQGFRKLPDV